MAENIDELVHDAEERLRGLHKVRANYPDARRGEVYGRSLIASKLALKDCDQVLLIVQADRGDNVLVPFLQLGTVAVFGWGDSGPWPLELVLKDLREKHPEAHAKILEVCRR